MDDIGFWVEVTLVFGVIIDSSFGVITDSSFAKRQYKGVHLVQSVCEKVPRKNKILKETVVAVLYFILHCKILR